MLYAPTYAYAYTYTYAYTYPAKEFLRFFFTNGQFEEEPSTGDRKELMDRHCHILHKQK